MRGFILSVGFVLLFLGAVVSLDAQEVVGQRALLDQYCIACHNGRMQAGNLELDSADIGDVASNPVPVSYTHLTLPTILLV